jgi:hypothetical protein
VSGIGPYLFPPNSSAIPGCNVCANVGSFHFQARTLEFWNSCFSTLFSLSVVVMQVNKSITRQHMHYSPIWSLHSPTKQMLHFLGTSPLNLSTHTPPYLHRNSSICQLSIVAHANLMSSFSVSVCMACLSPMPCQCISYVAHNRWHCGENQISL